MPSIPRIHLVRHAQGFHNLGFEFHSLPDPKLTPLGESQCATLQSTHFPPPSQSNISLVTASPLSRTLHTASLAFSPALRNGKCKPLILAIPDAQETSDFPCDTGSDVDVLKGIIAEQNWKVDLSLVKDGWNVKTLNNRYSPASRAIQRRARDARILLRQKARELAEAGDEDVEIVLVAHGGYLHYLTDDWEDSDKLAGTGWENCEFRTYNFEHDFLSDSDEEAYFSETMESRKRRGKDHPMFDHEKQKELFEMSMQGWEDQGLQRADKLGAEDEASQTGQEPAAKNMDLDRKTGEVEVMA
jgi:broad specificity phosphatase PhoE